MCEENGSRNLAGTPGDAKYVTEILWENKEVGVGTKFKIGKLILSKKNK